ncbi:MAG: hypothetical protein K2H79_02270 [Bacteroidaceae bacterium]|nr:hypothetical protein [Bacteroidaceae bacterium]MDE7165858.1 hypothetical protein [Bacteroidaceae bacterium]
MKPRATYIAFDANAVQDAVNSNLHTFRQLQEWAKNHPDRFRFVNMNEIEFSAQHDDLLETTTKSRFLKLMAEADNLLVVASPVVNTESHILNWQISRCVNRFHLPVVIAYAGLTELNEDSIQKFWAWLPNKPRKYIGLDSARMAHIPLTRDKLERALGTFSVSEQFYPWNSTTIF